ncbi:MAG: C40 family peptidase [Actinobacteria bacterium]|nr:C40 family peptidase [Actinomycetota bacterium]
MTPQGGFQDVLAAALDEGPGAPPPRTGPGSGPAAVPLARMLAVLGAGAGATPSSWPSGIAPSSGVVPTAAAPGSAAEAGPAGGAAVVDAASRYLGIPYRWGGSDPATGLDCSGLVQRAFDDLGVTVPRTSVEQSKVGAPVASLADARPGDLIFWASSRPGQANHIGIYVGDGKMLHAPQTGDVVKIAPVRTAAPTTIRRVIA